jgi:hypothetical protein
LRHPGLSDLFDLGSGIDKDRPDYTVVTGEWEVGRIYETRGGPDNLRWFWSMTVNGPMTGADRVATHLADLLASEEPALAALHASDGNTDGVPAVHASFSGHIGQVFKSSGSKRLRGHTWTSSNLTRRTPLRLCGNEGQQENRP